MPEQALIARAQRGDADARRELYETNVAMVYSFVAKRIGRDRADDITAEVFTKAFERLDRFEWRGIPLRSWLLRIAFNEVVGTSRRQAHEAIDVDTDDLDRAGRPGTDRDAADQLVDALDASDTVLAALTGLPARQRAAVELRYLRGLSVAEVGVALDLGDEAVRALTYRALRSLRAALAPAASRDPAASPEPGSP